MSRALASPAERDQGAGALGRLHFREKAALGRGERVESNRKRGWGEIMRAGSVSDSDMDVLVTGRRRRVVTVVQWHAAARARMVVALGWVMHDRMARVSDWGVT